MFLTRVEVRRYTVAAALHLSAVAQPQQRLRVLVVQLFLRGYKYFSTGNYASRYCAVYCEWKPIFKWQQELKLNYVQDPLISERTFFDKNEFIGGTWATFTGAFVIFDFFSHESFLRSVVNVPLFFCVFYSKLPKVLQKFCNVQCFQKKTCIVDVFLVPT